MLYYLYMMNNIKNNLIVSLGSGLGIFAFIAIIVALIVALSPISVFAYADGDNVIYGTEAGSGSNNSNTNNNNYQNRNPLPYISSVNPNFITVGSNSVLTVYGGNFVPSSMIRIDGASYPTTYLDSGRLSTQVGSSVNVGTRSVTVWSPAPGGGLSNTSYISVNAVRGASTTVSKAKTTKTVASNNGQVLGANTANPEYDYSALTANTVFGSNRLVPTGIMQWLLFAILILLIVIITRKIFVGDDEKNKPLKHA